MRAVLKRREWVERKLREEALRSRSFYKHAAIIFIGSKPVAWAYNHGGKCAEERALKKVPFGTDLRAAVMVTGRVNRYGEWRYGEPCDLCKTLINNAGVAWCLYVGVNRELIGNGCKRPEAYASRHPRSV